MLLLKYYHFQPAQERSSEETIMMRHYYEFYDSDIIIGR